MKQHFFSSSMLVMLIALFGQHPAVAQTVRYVDNLTNCASLAPCYSTIKDAIDAAAPFDTVKVFPGIYPEAVAISSKDHLTRKAYQEMLRPVVTRVIVDSSPGVQIEAFIVEEKVFLFGFASTNAVIQGNLVHGMILNGLGSCTVKNNTIIDGEIVSTLGISGCLIEGNRFINSGISIDGVSFAPRNNVIRSNVMSGGGISFGVELAQGNIVAGNLINDGGISFSGRRIQYNQIRGNVVRGNGIFVGNGGGGNTIESNFVSGGSLDGIHVRTSYSGEGGNVIRRNTSVEYAGCGINDSSTPSAIPNHWEMNRFATGCGAATN